MESATTQDSTPLDSDDPQQWLVEHGDALFAYAIGRVRNADAAEDLVQETLLGGMGSIDRFNHDASVRTWLIAILRYKILNHFRSRNRTPVSLDALLEPGITADQFSRSGKWRREAAPSDWAQESDRSELNAALQICLEELPPRAAEAFLLGEQNGISADEIGKMLELTTTNVYVMRHRARAALRKCLEQRLFSDASSEQT